MLGHHELPEQLQYTLMMGGIPFFNAGNSGVTTVGAPVLHHPRLIGLSVMQILLCGLICMIRSLRDMRMLMKASQINDHCLFD